MNLWEELDACKYDGNEYLVDYLIEIVKDDELNTLEDLENYEENYFKDSNMTKEEWVDWYIESFETIPEIDDLTNDDVALRVKQLRSELKVTTDINIKIKNIIMICALLEREVCFVVEAYNLILSGESSLDIVKPKVVKEKRNIVLCGSMKVKNDIFKTALILQSKGYDVLLPEECISGEEKSIASRKHFDRIVNPDNTIILVVNATRNGIPNYIGANSFAEIAMAFYHNKKIYLLNDIYEPYKDELIGWGVNCLRGELDNI